MVFIESQHSAIGNTCRFLCQTSMDSNPGSIIYLPCHIWCNYLTESQFSHLQYGDNSDLPWQVVYGNYKIHVNHLTRRDC